MDQHLSVRDIPKSSVVVFTFNPETSEVGVRLIKRPNYAHSLGSLTGLNPIWMDFSAIPDRAEWVNQNWAVIRATLDKLGLQDFIIKGHGQNAKMGLVPLVHKDATVPFSDPHESIRLGRLFAPGHKGHILLRDVEARVVDDNHPGLGDGTTLYAQDIVPDGPFQHSTLYAITSVNGEPQEGLRIALNKGMMRPTSHLPGRTKLKIPVGSLKGDGAKGIKIGDTLTVTAVISLMSAGVSGDMNIGYQISATFSDKIFALMQEDCAAELERINAFVTDPLAHLKAEDWEGEEETQGLQLLLPELAKLYLKTDNKDLLQSEAVATQLQNALGTMSRRLQLSGGRSARQYTALPLTEELRRLPREPDTVWLSISEQRRFPSGIALLIRYPIVKSETSVRAVRVRFTETLSLGKLGNRFMCVHPDDVAMMGMDFDADTGGLIPVKERDEETEPHWTMTLWNAHAEYQEQEEAQNLSNAAFVHGFLNAHPNMLTPSAVDEPYSSDEHAFVQDLLDNGVPALTDKGRKKGACFATRQEALHVAMSANVGEPTNLMTSLVAAQHFAEARHQDYIQAAMLVLEPEIHVRVDQVKHNGRPSRVPLVFARNTLKAVGIEPEDVQFMKDMKRGSKTSPDALLDTKEVNLGRWRHQSDRTPLGRQIRKWGPQIPVAFRDIRSNDHFKGWIRPRHGQGFDVATKLWKEWNLMFLAVKDSPLSAESKREHRTDIGRAWKAMWAELTETNEVVWMEQALSACWQLAFQNGAKQNLLWNTNVPKLFQLMAEDWGCQGEADIMGKLIGIGRTQIGIERVVVRCLGVKESTDQQGRICQFLLTPDNHERGWKVANAVLPVKFEGEVELTPVTSATSQFAIL